MFQFWLLTSDPGAKGKPSPPDSSFLRIPAHQIGDNEKTLLEPVAKKAILRRNDILLSIAK